MTAPILRLPFPQLSVRDQGDVTVVGLSGELDFLAVPALQACLRATRERPRSVADLTGLAFIDCACLGVLVRHDAEIRARNGSFALAGPQDAVRRALSVTRLISWFEVHDTVGQAVARKRPVQPALSALPRDVTGVTTVPAPGPGSVTTASPAQRAALPGTLAPAT
jgi:anti-sigma B factor antagonist